jgi:hypothetical protein
MSNKIHLRISETACEDDFTSCSNGQCLPSEWWCDNEVDCSNGADEYNCGELDILKNIHCPLFTLKTSYSVYFLLILWIQFYNKIKNKTVPKTVAIIPI